MVALQMRFLFGSPSSLCWFVEGACFVMPKRGDSCRDRWHSNFGNKWIGMGQVRGRTNSSGVFWEYSRREYWSIHLESKSINFTATQTEVILHRHPWRVPFRFRTGAFDGRQELFIPFTHSIGLRQAVFQVPYFNRDLQGQLRDHDEMDDRHWTSFLLITPIYWSHLPKSLRHMSHCSSMTHLSRSDSQIRMTYLVSYVVSDNDHKENNMKA